MADTSSAWQSRDNDPQGDLNVIHLELHDHGQAIAELTTTINQLAKAQLQQVQSPKQVNAMEGVSMMLNKRRTNGPQVKNRMENYVQEDSGFDQDESYNEQDEEVIASSAKEEIPNNVDQSNDEIRIDIDDSVVETQEEVNPSKDNIIDIPELLVQKSRASLPKPPPPYPHRLAKQNGENQFKKFIQIMKSLSINVPLVEALEKCPLEDPGAFTIPCTIGSDEFAKSLCDLGASINLMPYSVFKTLGIGQPRPTSMRLQMADRTMKRPLGVIEDVFIRVDKFIISTDFVILDCEVDYEVTIILGRPFLDSGKVLCDVEAGTLTFRVGDEKVDFTLVVLQKRKKDIGWILADIRG
uniref:Uncharacterized protein LOC104226534 n=1 Tax=Nicotiana sylvestris TaxID=4096 RepID=A0A1U7WHW1_NICSY|nr:PREDICTED: uncharacterized protein LOC104226534 [Nicotiana sylvestris]